MCVTSHCCLISLVFSSASSKYISLLVRADLNPFFPTQTTTWGLCWLCTILWKTHSRSVWSGKLILTADSTAVLRHHFSCTVHTSWQALASLEIFLVAEFSFCNLTTSAVLLCDTWRTLEGSQWSSLFLAVVLLCCLSIARFGSVSNQSSS